MRREKLNLKAINKVLNRDELKKIMAGSGTGTGTGGTGGGCIQCAPGCSSVLVYCRDSSGRNLGTVLGYTCSLEGQLYECNSGGYPTAVSTNSDCTCHPG